MNKFPRWLTAVVALLSFHGCASGPAVNVDYDQQANFQTLKSYAWAPITEEEQREKSRNSLIHERIQTAVTANLTGRGYTKAAVADADFLVTHTIKVEQITHTVDTRMTVGYGRYGSHGGFSIGAGMPVNTAIEQYKVGVLIIDVIDARLKRLIWRGTSERILGEVTSPQERTDLINSTVNDILGRFPPTSKKP